MTDKFSQVVKQVSPLGYDIGEAAYERGDYAAALGEFRPLPTKVTPQPSNPWSHVR